MKSVVLAFLTGSALLASAFTRGEVPVPDFLSTLGLTEDAAEDLAFNSFWTEYVWHPTGERVRAFALGDRPAVVREAIQFARSYFSSETFRTRYAAAREEARPRPPEGPKSGEELIQEMKEQLQAQIADTKARAAESPPEVKAMLLETIPLLEAQLADLDSPDNPYRDPAMSVVFARQAALHEADYQEEMAEWEKAYPEDPNPRIAQRLEETLALCADVDFSASLIDNGDGLKLFASTAYEMKPTEWKSCFRAGQGAVEAARSAIGDWLAELR